MDNTQVQAGLMAPGRQRPFYLRALTAVFLERRLPYQLQRRLSRAYYLRKASAAVFRFVRWTPPVVSTESSDLEVVTLLDRANVHAYLIGIKSFLYHSGRKARITILSDGSVTKAQSRLLEQHIRGVRIINTRGGRVNVPGRPDRLQKIYDEHVHTRKALALPLEDLKDTILLLDSDVIFRSAIDPDFTDLASVDLKYNRDHDHRIHDPLFHLAESFMDRLPVKQPVYNLNSGLLVFRKSVLNLGRVADFLLYLDAQDKLHAVMEQDCYALLASMVRSQPLSDRYWVGCNPDHNSDPLSGRQAIAKHYVSGVRYQSLDYIRDCWRAMRACRLAARRVRQP